MLRTDKLLLYLCTDRSLSLGRPLTEVVEAALDGGVTMVQIREKDVCTRDFFDIARSIQELTSRRGIPLVINDRLDIALALGAEGLHIGQSDLPLKEARRIAGDRLFIGVSASTIEKALQAQAEGADYLGVGAVYPTGSKADAGAAIGLDGLHKICGAVGIPVVGIGGINAQNARGVLQSGAQGVAVISAILSQSDVAAAARTLRAALV
ncbi:thiamine phosphate synthase [Breznakiellaceae bacterium SP9]